MQFLFQILAKEKRWFLLCFFFILISAILTIVQAVFISNIVNFSFNLASINSESKVHVGAEKLNLVSSPSIQNTNEILNPLIPSSSNSEQLKSNTQQHFSQSKEDKISITSKIKKLVAILIQDGSKKATLYILSQRDNLFILLLFIFVIFTVILNQFFIFLRNFSADYLSIRVITHIRELIFAKILKIPVSFYHNNNSGDVLSKSINDTNYIQTNLYDFIEASILGPIITFFSLMLLCFINWQFTLIILITLLIVAIIFNFVSKKLKIIVVKMQRELSNITTHLQHVMRGINIIKIYQQEKKEKSKFKTSLNLFLKNAKFERAVFRLNRPISEIIGTIGFLIIFVWGGSLIYQQELSTDDIFTFLIILLFVSPYAQRLGNFFLIKQQLEASTERILNVLNAEEEEDNHTPIETKYELKEYQGRVEFKNVNYEINHKKIIDNVSFKIEPKQFIGITGESGSGKSTLFDLISLLTKPTGGDILFDNVSFKNLSLKEIRKHISYVPQDTVLFSSSIKDNITYGLSSSSYTEEDLIQACKMANIYDFIQSCIDGFETLVGEKGVFLSGGQKQRISIARALLNKSSVILMDEFTSALDNQSQQKIIEALKKVKKTFIVSAHKINTIIHADQILVFKDGALREQGTHETLSTKSDSLYSKIYLIKKD